MNSWVVQRAVDGHYFNGFRLRSWSASIVGALAFDTKEEAQTAMANGGWQGVVYLVLPQSPGVRGRLEADVTLWIGDAPVGGDCVSPDSEES